MYCTLMSIYIFIHESIICTIHMFSCMYCTLYRLNKRKNYAEIVFGGTTLDGLGWVRLEVVSKKQRKHCYNTPD